MRALVLADGVVGRQIVQYLIEFFAGDIALVVTIEENDIVRSCAASGVPVTVFQSEEQVISALGNSDVDLGITCWWPHILRETLLNAPKDGFVNTHPSLLPHNRGKHPNFWALVEEAPFGVSLHSAEAGIDSGDVIAQQVIGYDWTDNAETLYKRALEAMVRLFIDTYPKLRAGRVKGQQQDLAKGSFHRASEIHALSRIDLDTTYSGRDLLNRLRARTFSGHPACWFESDGVAYEVRVDIRRKPK